MTKTFSMQMGQTRMSPCLGLMLFGVVALSGCATVSSPPTVGVPLRSPPRAEMVPLPSAVQTIVIDAGHGGHDPGTQHFGLKEKHLALDIARRLSNMLQQEGFEVVMTRETDQFIPLSGRPAIANRLQAALGE